MYALCQKKHMRYDLKITLAFHILHLISYLLPSVNTGLLDSNHFGEEFSEKVDQVSIS